MPAVSDSTWSGEWRDCAVGVGAAVSRQSPRHLVSAAVISFYPITRPHPTWVPPELESESRKSFLLLRLCGVVQLFPESGRALPSCFRLSTLTFRPPRRLSAPRAALPVRPAPVSLTEKAVKFCYQEHIFQKIISIDHFCRLSDYGMAFGKSFLTLILCRKPVYLLLL